MTASRQQWFLTGSLSCLVMLALSDAALAAYQCRLGDDVASIEIVGERPKGELPCRVMFSPGTGARETLWRVQFERGVCAKKASDKRDRLEDQGWRCEATGGPMRRMESRSADPILATDASADTASSADDVRDNVTERSAAELNETTLVDRVLGSYQCRLGEDVASIEIIGERPKGELPCQVVFSPKPDERNRLWRVQFERGLCGKKAAEKRNTLAEQGWSCQATGGVLFPRSSDDTVRAERPVDSRSDDQPAIDDPNDRCQLSNRAQTALCQALRVSLAEPAASAELEGILAAGGSDKSKTLSLVDSVSLALRNSREIDLGTIGRTRDRLTLEIAEDEFRPDLTIESELDFSDGSSSLPTTDGGISSSVGLRLPTGGELSVGWENDINERDANRTRLTGEVTQPLWRSAGLDANLADLRSARIDYRAGDLAFKERVITLVTSVVTSHRNLTLAETSYEVAVRSLERARQQRDINEKLLRAGRIARFEAVQSEANIANREVDLASAEIDLEDSRRQLLDLLDIKTDIDISAGGATALPDVTINAEDALSAAFSLRTDYRQALLALQIAKLGLATVRSEQRIGVDLVAGVDYDADLFSERDLERPAETNYRGGLRVNIPIGDVARDLSVRQAKLGIRESDIALVENQNQIENEIANLLANIGTTRKRVDLAERAEVLANEQLSAEQKKYSTGLSSTLDVISLEDALIDAQLATLSAKIEYSNVLTELDQAMGTTLSSWGIVLEP